MDLLDIPVTTATAVTNAFNIITMISMSVLTLNLFSQLGTLRTNLMRNRFQSYRKTNRGQI